MAANTVGVLVDMSVRGRDAVRGAADDLGRIDGASKRVAGGLGSMAMSVAAAGAALGAAGFAAKKLYDTLRVGATLSTTQERFDKLTASIGTTADAMLGQLRTATKGMISDMSLMESASGIVSLRLAENEDQVIRLATVVGTLGWDMQQVVLTFSNLSTMRLDALGLSVEEVKTKAAELEKAGMSAQEAFKEAVILAGEARLDVGGVSETEQAFKQAEAAVANFKNALLLSTVATLEQAGAFDQLANAARRMSLVQQITELDTKLRESGEGADILGSKFARSNELSTMTTTQLAVEVEKLKNIVAGLDPVVQNGSQGWRQYGVITGMALMGIENELDILRYLAGETTMAVAQGAAAMAGAVTDAQATIIAGYIGNADAIRQYNREQGNAVSSNVQLYRVMSALGGKMQEVEEVTNSFGGAISSLTSAEMALAEAHGRMAAAFNQEISAKIEDGLIDAAGLANMSEANKLLFEQARAAGATAGQLAMLGVATGQFTAEQAQAALKAAILSEKIKQIAAGVVSGALTGDQAAAGLASFSDQLNSGAIADAQAGIEGATAAADEFASGSYEAELAVQNRAAMQAIDDTAAALAALTGGTYTINIGVNSPLMPGPTTSTAGGTGPEVVPTATTPGGRSVGDKGGGGTTYNVTVSNFVDGRATSRTALDDVTTDSLKRAMSEIGIGKR